MGRRDRRRLLRSWQYSCSNRPDQPQSQRERLEHFLVGNDVMRGILKPNSRVNNAIEACWQVARTVLDDREPDRSNRNNGLKFVRR